MDIQRSYNEAMENLTEAQQCQSDISKCNVDLNQVQNAIYAAISYKIRFLLQSQFRLLVSRTNEKIKERDEKINDALSKALDILNNEADNNIMPQNSLGIKLLGEIFFYLSTQNIQIQYSMEVHAKRKSLAAKGIGRLLSEINRFKW